MSLRFAFAGTPDFAARILTRLLAAGYHPECVYTRPDKARGRGRNLQHSEVKALALQHDLPTRQPRTLKDPEAQAEFCALDLDLFIVAAYGLILPGPVLHAPRWQCVNVHASLLPRWRGAAPIERAIMHGDQETGISLMRMEAGLDTGPVFSSHRLAIDKTSTGPQLTVALADLGARALVDFLPHIEVAEAQVQDDSLATYANKLTDADTHIDWAASAVAIERKVRALCERAPVTGNLQDVAVKLLACEVLDEAESTVVSTPGTIQAANKQGIDVTTGRGLLRIARAKLNRGKGSVLGAADLLNGYGQVFQVGARFDA